MSEIDFEFATQDDCLQKMVPSDLRAIINERDHLREENTDLLAALEKSLLLVDTSSSWSACRDFVQQARAAIAKAKGEQE